MKQCGLVGLTLLFMAIGFSGCVTYRTSGMRVSITGNVTDADTGASIPDVSVSLAVEDNGFTARKHAEVSTSNDSGRIGHDEFVGWCQRVGPLGHIRSDHNAGTIEITLTHPKYNASSYSYTFEKVWNQERHASIIALGDVVLTPQPESVAE